MKKLMMMAVILLAGVGSVMAQAITSAVSLTM